MTSVGLVYLGIVTLALGWLIWRLATMKTDPEGFSTVASYSDENHVGRAERILESAGIPYRLDDHSAKLRYRGTGTDIRLLVPNDRVAEAANLIRAIVASPPSQAESHDS